jgi:transposase
LTPRYEGSRKDRFKYNKITQKHKKMATYKGIDVGKDTLDIAYELSGRIHSVKTDNSEAALDAYLSGETVDTHFVFEATGPYHLCLAYALKSKGLAFTIVNPSVSSAYSKSLASTAKTDRRDAVMLLRFGQERRPAPSRLPDESWQQARQEIAEWQHCKNLLLEEGNRLHSLSAWAKSSAKAVGSTKKRIAMLEAQVADMEAELFKKGIKGSEEAVAKALTIKGIGAKTANCLVFFTGGLESFGNAKQLAKYIGVAPAVHQSGKMTARGRITKQGNPLIRSLLYNCAKSAKRFNPACKELYERMRAKGKPHKLCMIAVAHKLLRQFFAVVKGKTDFDPAIA